MFRTWRIRQRNPVWVHKLADIVTSLWLGIIVLPRVIQCDICIFGLIKQHHNWNKWIVCVQILVGFGFNIWRDHYCLENDYDNKTKLSIIYSFAYILVTHIEIPMCRNIFNFKWAHIPQPIWRKGGTFQYSSLANVCNLQDPGTLGPRYN